MYGDAGSSNGGQKHLSVEKQLLVTIQLLGNQHSYR